MNNLPNDNQHNLVGFLRRNKPNPPQAHQNLEQVIMNSLEPQTSQRSLNRKLLITIVTQLISINAPFRFVVTSFLLTFVSFCFQTSRIAIEPKDLEKFVVKNWHETLQKGSFSDGEGAEAYWLLPIMAESNPNLSISAQ